MLTGTYRTARTETDRWWEELPDTRLVAEKPTAHVFPRLDTLVLGGITEESERLDPDDTTTQGILRRCAELDPRTANAEVVAVAVGLRPARSSVRLEVEPSAPPVVHNYGHGGGGVTLSWGCAAETRRLCAELIG